MARTKHGSASDTLEELESLADRLSAWLDANRVLALGVAGGILVAAAAVGGYASWSSGREDRAAAAVSALRDEYLTAMGGAPGDLEVPEPANPETGRQLREEFAERFLAVGQEYGGADAGVEARLEAGALLAELGRTEQALEVWQRGLAAVGNSSALRGLLLERIARAHEAAGRFAEAAEAHERAAEVEGFPLRHLALADAARCWVEAGDLERAAAHYARIRSEKPLLQIPDHVESRLREAEALREPAPDTASTP